MLMKSHSIRNLTLVGGGMLALLLLLPADKADRAGVVAPIERSATLAAAPELVDYLKASLSAPVVAKAEATSVVVPPAGVARVDAPVDTQMGAQVINASISTLPAVIKAPEAAAGAIAEVPAVAEADLVSVGNVPVNVRSGPSKTSGRLFVLQANDKVRVLGHEGAWAQIRTEDGNDGWVYSSFLASPGQAENPAAIDAPIVKRAEAIEPRPKLATGKAKVFKLANAVVLRSRPSRTAPRLGTIESGARVTVAEWRGAWVRIILPSGVSGWVRSVEPG